MRALFMQRQLDRDLDDELAFHLALKQRTLENDGVDATIAARQAHHAVGNTAKWKESTREAWIFTWLEGLWRDVAFGTLVLAKDKVFTTVALVTLMLGIGANTAIFSLINGLMLRALPVKDPNGLVRVRITNLPPGMTSWRNGRTVRATEQSLISFALFEALAKQHQIFSGIFGIADGGLMTLLHEGTLREVRTAPVTGSYFPVLGVQPQAGRLLAPEDDVRGGPSEGWNAVISDNLWSTLFQRRPEAIGAKVTIDRALFTIVGVASPAFHGFRPGNSDEVWIPLSALEATTPNWHWRTDPGYWVIQAVGRLRPGSTVDTAGPQLSAMSQPLLEEAKPTDIGSGEKDYLAQKIEIVSARSGSSWVAENFGKSLWILLAAIGVVLCIAATNLTNLLLARFSTRRQEITIRMAIGASAQRIRRQLLIECALIAVAGTALGVVYSQWLLTSMVSAASAYDTWIRLDVSLDWIVLGFTAVVSAGVVLIAGGTPAWSASRTDIRQPKSQTSSQSTMRFRSGLIVFQMSLSLALLGGAGLLLSSLRSIFREATGFHAEQTVLVAPNLSSAGFTSENINRAYRNALGEVRRLPIVAAAWTRYVPMTGAIEAYTAELPNRPDLPSNARMIFVHQVTDGYFSAMGIPLLLGQDFSPEKSARPACIVSENLARKFFGSAAKSLGQNLVTNHASKEIIGVVADSKYNHIRESALLTAYFPYWDKNPSLTSMTLAVKYSGSREPLLAEINKIFQRETGRPLPLQISTIEEKLSHSVMSEKVMAGVLTVFAIFALLISITGTTGLLSYTVQLRRKEIGIRMALGATPVMVRRQFQRQGLLLGIFGLLLGGIFSYWLRRVIDSYLFRTESGDPAVWIGVSLILLSCAFAAAAIPAYRASRLNPMQTLQLD